MRPVNTTLIDRKEVGLYRKALAVEVRVISALVLREARTRFGKSRLGYTWALLEPISYVLSIAALFMMGGRSPSIGSSFAEFLLTGIVPFMAFRDTTNRLTGAISANRSLLMFPIVRNTDVIAGRASLEILTQAFLVMILFAGFAAVGLAGMPDDLLGFLKGFGALILLGLGVGTMSAVGSIVVPNWDALFGMVMRVLFFTSGAFFALDQMPTTIARYLAWNPVIHGVEWVRAGYFLSYKATHLDREYILVWGVVTLTLGLLWERAARRRIATE